MRLPQTNPNEAVAEETNSTIIRAISKLKTIRLRALGTLSLVATFLLAYFIEMLVAELMGYPNPKAMLDATQWKSLLAILTGPLVHQTPLHLVKNLTSLVIVGSYIEYAHDERTLYEFAVFSGYASIWAIVLIDGLVGSVGASGITFGLWAWATVYASYRLVQFISNPAQYRLIGHVIPLSIGLTQGITVINGFLDGSLGGSDISHLVGFVMGILIGLYLISSHWYDSHTTFAAVLSG
jgi:membrane associated rhomboid family serine protease